MCTRARPVLHRAWRSRRRRSGARLPHRDEGRAPRPRSRRRAIPFPADKTYYEIPIAIQDRAFNSDGSLFYPDTRAFFDGATEEEPGFIPDGDLSPIWNPEFFGNMIMVNGNTWPTHTVEQRRYRFRFLNGCQSRFLILDFSKISGVEVWQIGNEGGFLTAPVNITDLGNRLLMGLAERADVIVDFTNVSPGSYVLGNLGPDEPFGGGEPGKDFESSDPAGTGMIMEFKVVAAAAADPTTPPKFLHAAGPHAPAGHHQEAAPGAHGDDVGEMGRPGGGQAGHHGRQGRAAGPHVGGARDREPGGGRHRDLGDVQLHGRRAPDARARGGVRGGRPGRAGAERATGSRGPGPACG